jgi:hypothetical protein
MRHEMADTPLPRLTLYMRPGCHLCEDARALLDTVLADRHARGLPAPAVEERNIETNQAWHAAFLTTIPVVEIGERRLELATSAAKLQRFLADALDANAAPTRA